MQLDLFKLEDKKEFKIIDEKHRLYIEALFEDYILGFYTDKNINENINKVISGLNECGNEVVLCNKEIIEQLLKNYLKRNVEIESY